jgi:hypothetical protein
VRHLAQHDEALHHILVSDFECVFTTVRVHSLRRMLPSHCLQPITRWHVVRACAKSSRACVSFNSAAGVFVKLVCNFEVRKRAFLFEVWVARRSELVLT